MKHEEEIVLEAGERIPLMGVDNGMAVTGGVVGTAGLRE
jgi:hypothetical protein